MKITPILFTLLIAAGAAILLNAWKVSVPAEVAPRMAAAMQPHPAQAVQRVPASEPVAASEPVPIVESAQRPAVRLDSTTLAARIESLKEIASIKRRLFRSDAPAVRSLDITLVDDVLQLEGTVRTEEERDQVFAAVSRFAGDRLVKNDLRVVART